MHYKYETKQQQTFQDYYKDIDVGIDFGTTTCYIGYFDRKTSQQITICGTKDGRNFIHSNCCVNKKNEKVIGVNPNDYNINSNLFSYIKLCIGKMYDELDTHTLKMVKENIINVNGKIRFTNKLLNSKQKEKEILLSPEEIGISIFHELKEMLDRSIGRIENEIVLRLQKMIEDLGNKKLNTTEIEMINKLIGRIFGNKRGLMKEYLIEYLNTEESEVENVIEKIIEMVEHSSFEEKDIENMFKTIETKAFEKYAKNDEQFLIQCVITIPAGFGQNQRDSLEEMARAAGFRPQFLFEPTAATLTYYNEEVKEVKGKENIMVFDFGGGTLDITVSELHKKKEKIVVEINSSNGNMNLGGKNVDLILKDQVINMVKQMIADSCGEEEVENFKMNTQREKKLMQIITEKKCELSSSDSITIDISDFYGSKFEETFEDCETELTITKEEFSAMISTIKSKSEQLIYESLEQSKKSKEDIDRVILIGGSSKIRAIQEMIEELFGREKIAKGVDSLTAVVKGACYHAKQNLQVKEIIQNTIGMARFDGSMITIFEKNTKLPAERIIPIKPEKDGATEITIKLREGPYKIAGMNAVVDEMKFSGLSGVNNEDAYIELIFKCDKYGKLEVTLIDYNNDEGKKITLECTNKINHQTEYKNEIEELVKLLTDDQKEIISKVLVSDTDDENERIENCLKAKTLAKEFAGQTDSW